MAFYRLVALVAPALLRTQAATSTAEQGNSAITQVVVLLQSMLDTSKVQGGAERDAWAKYKCYCDTNEEEKTKEIADLKDEIGLLESSIEGLLASSAVLSQEVAQLDKDMTDNQNAQSDATTLREQESGEYNATNADLSEAIVKLRDATQKLIDVGGDQNLAAAADHNQYMAGHGQSELQTNLQQALIAASAFITKKQAAVVDSFLQTPFTGTYTAQSGEVVGILQNMRTTFKANLEAATAAEEKALAAYNLFMNTSQSAYNTMSASKETKNGELSGNDGALSTKKGQLGTAQESLSGAEVFLDSTLTACAAKKKQYEERVSLRTGEEAAISEAISILNSDAAFETFSTVDAAVAPTAPTMFVQLRSVHRHQASATQTGPTQKAQEFLQRAAGSAGHPMLRKALSLLKANNPFTVVLAEIEKMINLIAEEEQADVDQKGWCETEREDTDGELSTKRGQITTLEGEIGMLITAIQDPVTGLTKQIADEETTLQENHDSQVSETATRKDEHSRYQKRVANLVEAEELLTKAITVLEAYYSKITAAELLQKRKEDPPNTWNDQYSGQSGQGSGAITALRQILTNTKSEQDQQHTNEMSSQTLYEDSMGGLKTAEGNAITQLGSLKESLAEKHEELIQKDKDLMATTKEVESLEAYLMKIKPGCDFIAANYATRSSNRVTETNALNQAVTLIEESPAYVEAMGVKHNESLGDCLSICGPSEDHVDCKACLADTSVPGYCAGHPETVGC